MTVPWLESFVELGGVFYQMENRNVFDNALDGKCDIAMVGEVLLTCEDGGGSRKIT